MRTSRRHRRQRTAYPSWPDPYQPSADQHWRDQSSPTPRDNDLDAKGVRRRMPFNVSKSRIRRLCAKWRRVLARKRVISLLNLAVFILLTSQMVSIVRMGFDVDLPSEILDSIKLDELPYPLNIVVQVHRKNITLPPRTASLQLPGYVNVQAGTFRNHYPSTELTGTNTFDASFVITNDRCERQWDEFQIAANKIPLTFSKWTPTNSRQISLKDPPIPIAPEAMRNVKTGNRAVMSIVKRQLSYMDAHRRLWQYVVDTRKQRVLVLDDTLFLHERLRKSLPALLTNVDQESIARQKAWHFLFLRRQKLSATDRESAWTMNPVYNHAVVVANVSHGIGAYVLSLPGARFLLHHVNRYRAPLDVEIGLLQRDFPDDFVALSACNNNRVTPFCPEVIQEIAVPTTRPVFDCVWRRVQERHTAAEFPRYFET